MSIEEMVTVFRHLDDKRKRLLLEHEYGHDEVQVTKVPSIYRDILSVIAKYIDLPTFGRLKQSCKAFNQYLVEYRELATIRRYYAGDGPLPLVQMIRMFKACAMRLKRQLEAMVNREVQCESLSLVAIRYEQLRTRLPWWDIKHVAQVRYPYGYICKTNEAKKPLGHIFQLNPLDCFRFENNWIYLIPIRTMTTAQKEERKRLTTMIAEGEFRNESNWRF